MLKLKPTDTDTAVDTVDTGDMVDTVVVDTMARDLLNLILSLKLKLTMVDTMEAMDTDVDTMVMVDTVVDTDTMDVKGDLLKVMPKLTMVDITVTVVDTVTADTADMGMVTVDTTDKCHLSSHIEKDQVTR